MYNYIYGRLEERSENQLVIEANGIGFELLVSSYCLEKYSKIGESYRVPVVLMVREDEMRLFGFRDSSEKSMFKKLISISGIGPKVAIAILSGIPLDELTVSILNGNTKNLNKIKGIGKKTAERIVLELRDKFSEEYEQLGISEMGTSTKLATIAEEAVMALISLGMSKSEAISAVTKINHDGMTLEEVLYKALRLTNYH